MADDTTDRIKPPPIDPEVIAERQRVIRVRLRAAMTTHSFHIIVNSNDQAAVLPTLRRQFGLAKAAIINDGAHLMSDAAYNAIITELDRPPQVFYDRIDILSLGREADGDERPHLSHGGHHDRSPGRRFLLEAGGAARRDGDSGLQQRLHAGRCSGGWGSAAGYIRERATRPRRRRHRRPIPRPMRTAGMAGPAETAASKHVADSGRRRC